MERPTLTTSDITEAVKIYEESFPSEERRPTASWRQMVLSPPSHFHFLPLHKERRLCGFLTSWSFPLFLYVEHFAVDSNLRGSGLGGKLLDKFLQSAASRPVLLEVEPPVTFVALRRIRFYQRHGFTLLPYHYEQPPYQKGGIPVPLSLMTTHPHAIMQRFSEVLHTLYKEVYGTELPTTDFPNLSTAP